MIADTRWLANMATKSITMSSIGSMRSVTEEEMSDSKIKQKQVVAKKYILEERDTPIRKVRSILSHLFKTFSLVILGTELVMAENDIRAIMLAKVKLTAITPAVAAPCV